MGSLAAGAVASVGAVAGLAIGAGGTLVGAGGVGSDFGEQAARSAMPTKGVISMNRRRDVDRVMMNSCGGPNKLPWGHYGTGSQLQPTVDPNPRAQ